jgi:outer membrane protein assembly factor BamB
MWRATMPTSEDAVVFYCPSCGASIAMQGDRGICAFCGTAIERPQAAASPAASVQRQADRHPEGEPIVWPIQMTTITTAALARPRRRSSCLGALIWLIILGAIGFGVGQAVTGGQLLAQIMKSTGISGSLPAALTRINLGPISKLAAVLPRDGKGGDLLIYAYGVGDSRYTVALIDGSSQAARWQSQPLSKDAYQGTLVAGRDLVYLTDHDQLLALRMTDGTLAWQVTLDVEPQNSCEECLRLVGNHVVVLEKNGGLQAFTAPTGKLAWNTRLANTPRRLPVAGERLVTLQPSADNKSQTLAFLDPTTGKAAVQIEPHCPQKNGFSELESPESYTPFLFSADGKAMYTMYGFFAKCAQRWDLASGKPSWGVALDDKLVPSSWHNGGPLLTDKAVFVGNNGLIWALDSASGDVRTIANNKEYNLIPLAARDDTLIVLATPTWDSQRQAIWGLDSVTGERRWQEPLQAHDLREGTSSGDWDWQLTPKGLVVVQILRDDAQLIVETLNPRTGISSSRQQTALTGLHIPSLQGALWSDDTAWLKIDSNVYAIDLATGKPAYQL